MPITSLFWRSSKGAPGRIQDRYPQALTSLVTPKHLSPNMQKMRKSTKDNKRDKNITNLKTVADSLRGRSFGMTALVQLPGKPASWRQDVKAVSPVELTCHLHRQKHNLRCVPASAAHWHLQDRHPKVFIPLQLQSVVNRPELSLRVFPGTVTTHGSMWHRRASHPIQAGSRERERENRSKVPGFLYHLQEHLPSNFFSSRPHSQEGPLPLHGTFNTWSFWGPKAQTIAPAIDGFSLVLLHCPDIPISSASEKQPSNAMAQTFNQNSLENFSHLCYFSKSHGLEALFFILIS